MSQLKTLLLTLLIASIVVLASSYEPTLDLLDQYCMRMFTYSKSSKYETNIYVDHSKGQYSHKLTTPQGLRQEYFYFQSNDTLYTFSEQSKLGQWTCVKKLKANLKNSEMDPWRSQIFTGMKYSGIEKNCLNVLTRNIALCNRYDNKIVTNMVIDYYVETNHTSEIQIPLQMYKIVGERVKAELIYVYEYRRSPMASDFMFPFSENICTFGN
ncbi:predicted protein [Naegleria gruberi]|uniref:Predicted protein n=1 Tax=Naegleria gruberi TaxID=5762 RepID=D2V998_NAEGR|nr:uncharacterized protein NAEGRDRAFT_65612 [Naegleria gruberi]EFC46553.1 predicted protein [Naegleria gruberi]|eukprot:XP_002679297.1 predicted protein [Naegleria gruberi strain NEG-M]